MYVTVTTADRTFSVGPGCPVDMRHIESPDVTAGAIIADARTDSEAGSVAVRVQRIGGAEALFWPAPVGGTASVYDSDSGAPIVAGVLTRVGIDATGIDLQVQL